MPCCTYLNDRTYKRPTSDNELNSLLAEVCKLTGDDWRIQEREFAIRRWFRSPRYVKLYTLYHNVSGAEFQIINFYRPDKPEWEGGSLNTLNDASHVAAYLYGILAAEAKLRAIEGAMRGGG